MLTFLFFSSLIFSQYNSQEWSSITSLLNPSGMIISQGGIIYSSTSGGLLEFNPKTERFNFLKEDEGIIYLDISSIAIDNNNRIWLGGSYPKGYLQIFEPNQGLLRKITHLEISQIKKIIIGEDNAFAIYQGSTNTENGILEFLFDDEGLPYYKDYYTNFSDTLITEITDLDFISNNLYITTNNGIYRGDTNLSLKNSSNWVRIYEGSSLQFIPSDINYILVDDAIMFDDGNGWFKYDLNLEGESIDAISNNSILYIVTEHAFYEIINGEINYSFNIPEISHSKTQFTSFVIDNNLIYLGLKDGGIMKLDKESNSYLIFNPDTPFQNEYNALTVTSTGNLVATSSHATLVDYGGRYHNFIPWQNTVNIPKKNMISNNISFSWDYLTYSPGENKPMSIIEQGNKNILFANSGIIPNDTTWLTTPAIIDLNIKTKNYSSIDTSNAIIDGLWGVYESQIYSSYMVINHIVKDDLNNVWVTNPYAEKNGNIVAIKKYNDLEWSHIHIPDNNSYIPTSIEFDRQRNAWISFEFSTNDNGIYSNGGLKVLHYSDLNFLNEEDSTWLFINNPEVFPGNSENASVWSITFDKMDFLWILNEKGIRGYNYSISNNQITLDPILKSIDGTPIDFLPHLSFVKGNKIKVDSQNNKWITTNEGVWIIQESLLYWPSEDGFNSENSGLLSDNVYDVAFNNDEGIVYIATDKGISIVQIPFADNPSKKETMYISPNPFIIPDDELVLIKNVASGSLIKIMTISGLVINEIQLSPNESQFLWDGVDQNGNKVGTAVYIISSHHLSELNKVSKIAVIKK